MCKKTVKNMFFNCYHEIMQNDWFIEESNMVLVMLQRKKQDPEQTAVMCTSVLFPLSWHLQCPKMSSPWKVLWLTNLETQKSVKLITSLSVFHIIEQCQSSERNYQVVPAGWTDGPQRSVFRCTGPPGCNSPATARTSDGRRMETISSRFWIHLIYFF